MKGSGVNPGASEELPKLGLLLPMLRLLCATIGEAIAHWIAITTIENEILMGFVILVSRVCLGCRRALLRPTGDRDLDERYYLPDSSSYLKTSLVSDYSSTTVRNPCGSSVLPRTVSRNRFWMSSVMGPAFPDPISILSTLATGVTSAAVPVKKISSTV